MSKSYEDVVITTPISVPYVRYSDRPANYWLGRALGMLSEASGLGAQDIDGLSVSSFTLAPDSAATLTQHFGMTPRWLSQEVTGGASGITALRKAARAVQMGDADIVACIGGDTNPKHGFETLLDDFSSDMSAAVLPYGAGGPNVSFALITRAYMQRYGAKREDFGRLAVSQRQNALGYPQALMKKPLTLNEYLEVKPISSPLHLFDCVMPCAGAEGYLVMSASRARTLGLPYVHIRATCERHNAYSRDDVQLRTGLAMDAQDLWTRAGVCSQDMDVVQSYDDYPVISFMQLEDLGFCPKGTAKDFVQKHDFTVAGSFPHNTSGGQLSCGQAGAAGGFLGLVELVRQLTGSALGEQVQDARLGLVSGFGIINYDKGLSCAAAILERGHD
ncbi:MAG: acetyl-CoA acetyltransferase [Robiginitomaculum sp.]|nr:MAG: acetyl-CoA acetyltransferase [Robiginitomaculum sp.]